MKKLDKNSMNMKTVLIAVFSLCPSSAFLAIQPFPPLPSNILSGYSPRTPALVEILDAKEGPPLLLGSFGDQVHQ